MNLKAIDTYYNEHLFRSRLEARVAIFLDSMEIPWVYEEEGFVLEDGTPYLPDFYLPNQDAFLEVKGVMSEKDLNKIVGLWKASGKCVLVVDSGLNFKMYDSLRRLSTWYGDGVFPNRYLEWYPDGEDADIVGCSTCGKVNFIGEGYYGCLCCGDWDGDHLLTGKKEDVSLARYKAITARFEYDERKN